MVRLTPAQHKLLSRHFGGGVSTHNARDYAIAERLVKKGLLRHGIAKYTYYEYWLTDAGRAAIGGENG